MDAHRKVEEPEWAHSPKKDMPPFPVASVLPMNMVPGLPLGKAAEPMPTFGDAPARFGGAGYEADAGLSPGAAYAYGAEQGLSPGPAYGGGSRPGSYAPALVGSPGAKRGTGTSPSCATSECGAAGAPDAIHSALMKLADDFPVVNYFQRVNTGFYKLEGKGTCELSTARNSEKLFVKHDHWNRGVRGELVKFLQAVAIESPPSRTPSERSLQQAMPRPAPRNQSPIRRAANQSQGSTGSFRPPERMASKPTAASGRTSPTRTKPPTAVPKASTRPGVGMRRTPAGTANVTPRGLGEGRQPCRAGCLFVHMREPLLGDPLVLLESGEGDARVLARLLCSGRTAEVCASSLAPLQARPLKVSSRGAALAAFEEYFFVGDPEELDESMNSTTFGTVELRELGVAELANVISQCWPSDQPAPTRGLAWSLRPYLVDWLQRRQRLRHLQQLVVALPEEAMDREAPRSLPGAPNLGTLLMDMTERDILIALLLATPPAQRSRLYAFASDTACPLPMAFPALRCPCPPSDADEEGAPANDRGVVVQWAAFEALMARPSDKALVLSVGAHGCQQSGKSQLLKEVLGLEVASVDGPAPTQRGAAATPSQPCRSPVHSPGIDILKSPGGAIGWTADVHGCALGDPAWTSLLSTLAATSSLTLLHISLDDFLVESEGKVASPPAPRRAGQPPSAPVQRRGSAEQGPPAPAGSLRVTVRADLLALLRISVDSRLPGVGPPRTRVLVLLRDAGGTGSALVAGIRACLVATLGSAFAGLCAVDQLGGLSGSYRQRALAGVRSQVSQELAMLGQQGGQFPCIESLKRIYSHFYDRLTVAGEQPVLPNTELALHSRVSEVLTALLDQAEARAQGRLSTVVFPISEAASRLARLRAKEKRLLEAEGDAPDDAKVAELSAQLRALEKSRRDLLAQPLSPPVRCFAEVVLGEGRLKHSSVAEFGQILSAWRAPRMAPLVTRRRQLLDERLRLGQEQRGAKEGPHQAELAKIAHHLAETEEVLEQLNVTLDGFWEEIAAICDLSAELQGVGVRPPPELPDPQRLKQLYGDWAWRLNMPVQLLFGSPLQCAGNFLVDVLKDLGAQNCQDLCVISVIGIQSSAKSTLLNYLFGCGFATSAGRCTRGLYCSLMEAGGKTLLIMDTEGLMSLEADGGDVFDAQLALMAMACSHMVLINHKGELSRQLQDLLEVCLFAMQHLKVCRIQPRLLFVLRDQHDRSGGVHGDALRLMRKHLAEASTHLSLRLDELIQLDQDSVFLLPSAFASDVCENTGREVRWSTGLFANEALRLRQRIFQTVEAVSDERGDGESSPEFSTLPDWCLHAMSVWRVLDRYGPNLLHYKTIQEIELQRELEELVKRISDQMINGEGGLATETKTLLSSCTQRLGECDSSDQVDAEFRSSLQALLDRCSKRSLAELERCLQSRKSKFPEARKEEAKRKLQMPVEYQGELARYTWTLCLTEAVDRDQLRALKVHFKKTIEELWNSSAAIADEQARKIFAAEWASFEGKCKERFDRTTKTRKQLAEEVCLVFNHVLRQHRHGEQEMHVLELVPCTALLSEEPLTSWEHSRLARDFFEVRVPGRLAQYETGRHDRPAASQARQPYRMAPGSDAGKLEGIVVPEVKKHLSPVLSYELPEGATQMPPSEAILDAMRRLNEAVQAEESRFLSQLGVRFRGGTVAFLNAAHLCLRHSVLNALVAAETQRKEHQWRMLQSHRKHTEEEFLAMVQGRTSDAGRAKLLADMFFDALAREWLDETLVSVAADIRTQCLSDMPDASGAAERAYQQSFVERNWEDVIEYVLDVNAYLHKIFSSLFEDRKVSITRVQRPKIAAQLGGMFDALTNVMQRWGHREAGRRAKLSSFQATLQKMAAESRSGAAGQGGTAWPLLCERFPVVADFVVEDPDRFSKEFTLQVAAKLGEAKVEGLVADRLEAKLRQQQDQVWALIRGCSAMCPCCGSKCTRMDKHTVHQCKSHLLPAFNGWRVAGTCECALDACKSSKNHEAPKRSDYSDHLFPNLEEYLKAEHPEWLPFPKEDRELLADSVLKAAWVNCRVPLLHRYDMVDSTPAEWINAYEEPNRMLRIDAIEKAEERLADYGYVPEGEQ